MELQSPIIYQNIYRKAETKHTQAKIDKRNFATTTPQGVVGGGCVCVRVEKKKADYNCLH